jgi:hypothetical protein
MTRYQETNAAYAISARVERVSPRLRPAPPTDPGPDSHPATLEELGPAGQPAVSDVSGRGFAADLIELLEDIREVWRQGRDVMADPQGWR